ncbi:hypothetical protein DCC39_17265 [Pueribacillus theae]|uniref:HPr domain-containing protein n=1 Tax=Pueribacillus theae TaxID=2171751 RepID=A0A2U1JNZ0_9BACI|nr:HPr family phosphocarrier protein [Pueribacillus theae]PWA06715.1 hypothetical protein DCC39_17265 [Pueribacillus theae]
MRKIISNRIPFMIKMGLTEAIKWVEEAKKYKSNIYIHYNGTTVDSKKLPSTVSLFLTMKEKELLLIAEGEDAPVAIQDLTNILTSKLKTAM